MAAKRSAGGLREKLHFQSRAMEDDGMGNQLPVGEFETRFTQSAELKPRVGGEEVTAARLQGKQPYVCGVRFTRQMGDVTVGWQAVDARNPDRVFNVASPPADPDGKNQWLEFIVIDGPVS